MSSASHGAVRWRAPGRVNLIGEHTDYNDGFVLPFAIEQSCVATVAVRAEPGLLIRSVQQAVPVEVEPTDLVPGRVPGWAAYPAGVAWALAGLGVDVPGLVIEVDSSVPYGAGLSSSAALTCSVATALDDRLGLALSRDQLLAVTIAAENDFADAPTGGMDQLASLGGVAGHALFCDMRALTLEPVPFDVDAAGLALLVIDTLAEHRNNESEYRARRAGCGQAAALLDIPALRDVDDLEAALGRLPTDELRRYTRHIVTENDRVLTTVAWLKAGAIEQIGPLLTASHESLRHDYRVSVPHLDVAVAALLDAGALGARMTGGGFGGSVIALIAADAVDTAVAYVVSAYAKCGFARPAWFVAHPSDGARRLD